MRRYDEKVLRLLLDKYENSLLYTGENRRNQSISIRIEKKAFPEYFDEASGEFAVLHNQLQELEEAGLVSLVWKNKRAGHILERCVLVPENADQIYTRLHRLPRRDKEEKILEICGRYQGRHQTLDNFLHFIRERVEKRESIGQYADLDEPDAFAGRCELILHILENTEEIFLREFSVRFCGDSKAAEKEITGAAGIISRFSEEEGLHPLNAEQILEEFSIFRNPSWVMVKGCGRLILEGGDTAVSGRPSGCRQIDLVLLRDGIGLSSRDIDSVRWDADNSPERVITIENLTSFHRWEEKGTLAVYLGGYHNRAKRSFLLRLFQTFPKAEYAHFGDLDCGGFFIWKDLCEKTGIPFATRYMDETVFLDYMGSGKELTERDRRELERMRQDPFFREQRELFGLMLEKGRKLEQECIRGG